MNQQSIISLMAASLLAGKYPVINEGDRALAVKQAFEIWDEMQLQFRLREDVHR